MKSVGKQLQEARLAKTWTPELAARETKIKVDRIVDLEADDYSHFSSPTYARGFVRTYARALGLDEYRLLRQLDNKLPEDDNATFVQETGLPYVPETSQMVHASSSHRTGLYVFAGLALAVLLISAFVVFQAYRAGELPRYFANGTDTTLPATNAAADADAPPRAMAVDPNDTSHAPKAQPVDLSQLSPGDTNAAPATPGGVATAPASDSGSDTIPGARRALPVDLSTLNSGGAGTTATPAPAEAPATAPAPHLSPPLNPTAVAPTTAPATAPDATPPPEAATTTTADTSDDTTHARRALPVDPSELAANNAAPAPDAAATGLPPAGNNGSTALVTPVDLSGDHPVQESMAEAQAKKQLVLTASRDSFIRVTDVGEAQNQVLYASVLRAGQSVALSGRKFSVNVGIPSAVDIALDGVNYGPHSEANSPETFTIESHQP